MRTFEFESPVQGYDVFWVFLFLIISGIWGGQYENHCHLVVLAGGVGFVGIKQD